MSNLSYKIGQAAQDRQIELLRSQLTMARQRGDNLTRVNQEMQAELTLACTTIDHLETELATAKDTIPSLLQLMSANPGKVFLSESRKAEYVMGTGPFPKMGEKYGPNVCMLHETRIMDLLANDWKVSPEKPAEPEGTWHTCTLKESRQHLLSGKRVSRVLLDQWDQSFAPGQMPMHWNGNEWLPFTAWATYLSETFPDGWMWAEPLVDDLTRPVPAHAGPTIA